MNPKIKEFNGQPAVLLRWMTKKPQSGEHVNVIEHGENRSDRPTIRRLILLEELHSSQSAASSKITEELWSFREVSESEFHRMRQAAARSQAIEDTHNSLF